MCEATNATSRDVVEAGLTSVGLVAEHGFSALVTVRRGERQTTVLFDAGLSPDAMLINADRLGLDLTDIQAALCSATAISATPAAWPV